MDLKRFLDQIEKSERKFNKSGEDKEYRLNVYVETTHPYKNKATELGFKEEDVCDMVVCSIAMRKNIIVKVDFWYSTFQEPIADNIDKSTFEDCLKKAIRIEVELD